MRPPSLSFTIILICLLLAACQTTGRETTRLPGDGGDETSNGSDPPPHDQAFTLFGVVGVDDGPSGFGMLALFQEFEPSPAEAFLEAVRVSSPRCTIASFEAPEIPALPLISAGDALAIRRSKDGSLVLEQPRTEDGGYSGARVPSPGPTDLTLSIPGDAFPPYEVLLPTTYAIDLATTDGFTDPIRSGTELRWTPAAAGEDEDVWINLGVIDGGTFVLCGAPDTGSFTMPTKADAKFSDGGIEFEADLTGLEGTLMTLSRVSSKSWYDADTESLLLVTISASVEVTRDASAH